LLAGQICKNIYITNGKYSCYPKVIAGKHTRTFVKENLFTQEQDESNHLTNLEHLSLMCMGLLANQITFWNFSYTQHPGALVKRTVLQNTATPESLNNQSSQVPTLHTEFLFFS